MASLQNQRKKENEKGDAIPAQLFAGKKLRCLNQRLLSKGGYGSMYRGFWNNNSSEEEVAVRRIKVTDCAENWKDVADKLAKPLMSHENVLKMIGVEENADDQFRYFAFELYSGTLEQLCNGQFTCTMPSDARVLCQMAKGINHLHNNGFAHGNLNPRTILISQSGRIKVSEFGLNKFFDSNITDQQTSEIDQIESRLDSVNISGRQSKLTNVNQEPLSHPKYWTRTNFESLSIDSDRNRSIPFATVYEDIFSAGCLFFYYLKRGSHPFGKTESITANILAKDPVNLKELDEEHFAFKLIKNLIGDPPTDGKQWLQIAASEFEGLLPLSIDIKTEYGRGGYGIVFGGTYEGNRVAVKRIPVAIVGDPKSEDQKREVELHKGLEHDNVLKLLHVDDEMDYNFRYLVLELCAGTLTNFCENKYNGPALPSDELVLFQIALGLDYIHSRNLVHRDVKPDNILISATTPVQMKLSDFGLCKKVSPQGTFSQSGLKGTLNWMAQEQLEILNGPDNIPNDLPHGTIESDTFAAGCVFFYFLTRGSHPFGASAVVTGNIYNDNPLLLKEAKSSPNNDFIGYALVDGMIKKLKERMKLEDVIQQLLDYLSQAHKSQFKKVTRTPGTTSNSYIPSRFHPSDLVLACGLSNGQVTFFETKNPLVPFSNWREKKEKFHCQGGERVTALEWNVNRTQLAAGCADGTVIVWSYPSGDVIFEEKKHSRNVGLIAWNPFRQDVFATRIDRSRKELFFWNPRGENRDAEKANHFLTLDPDVGIWSVAWISANQIAIGLSNGEIEICEIDEDKGTSRFVTQFTHSEDWISGLEWNERTKYLASSSWKDKLIKIWSMDSDQPVHSLHLHSGYCISFAWRRNEKTDDGRGIDGERNDKENFILACGLDDGSVVIWNPLEEDETKRIRILPQIHSNRIESLSFSPDRRFLASVDRRGELIIWSTETWLPIFTCKNASSSLSWMFTDSSFVPPNKLAVTSRNKVLVVEESFTE